MFDPITYKEFETMCYFLISISLLQDKNYIHNIFTTL